MGVGRGIEGEEQTEVAHPIRRRRPGRGNEVQGFPSLNKCLLNANVGGEQKQVVRVVRTIHKHPFQSINAFCLMLNTQCTLLQLIHDGQAQCAEYGPGVMSKCKRTVLYCAISDDLKEVVCYGSVMEYDKNGVGPMGIAGPLSAHQEGTTQVFC